MKLLLVSLVWVAVVLSCEVPSTTAVNPGFRVIVTQKGLDYVNEVVFPILKETLRNFTIPPMSGEYKGIVTVEYTISNIVIESLDFGRSSVTSDLRGVVLTDNDTSLSISADWSYREDQWPHLKDHGSVDISASAISLSMSVIAKENKTGGHVELNTTGCSFNVGTIKVDFHGGMSWLYDLFHSAIESSLKDQLNKMVCLKATTFINTAGNRIVGSLPVVLNVSDLVEISYALVSDPDFSHPGYMVTNHKGEVLLISNPQDPPFDPPPLPDPSHFSKSKMVYIIATTYVAESASYAFWKAGFLAYNISNDMIPSVLSTTSAYCSTVSPELCKKFPDKKVMFGVVASDYPRVNITEGLAVMRALVNASMYVYNAGNWELAFTLALSVEADIKPSLWYNYTAGLYFVSANVSNPRINVSLAKSNIGNFNCSNLKTLITTFAPSFGLCYINEYTNAGFPIPIQDGVSLVNPTLKLGEGYVEVGADAKYSDEYLKKLRGIIL